MLLGSGVRLMVAALVAKLPSHSLHLNAPIARLEQTADHRWLVHHQSPIANPKSPIPYDSIILAAPAPAAPAA